MTQPYQSKDKDQDKGTEPKSTLEIGTGVGETRKAMSGDTQALNAKLAPGSSQRQGMGTMGGVKDAAIGPAGASTDVIVDKAIEVKDVVVDKTIEVKDAAAEKLSEAKDVVVHTMHDIGEQAARFGSATWRFSKENAVPLALFGAGAGWMIANTRRSSARRLEPAYGQYGGEAWEDKTEGYATSITPARPAGASARRQPPRATGYGQANAARNRSAPSPSAPIGARAHDMLEQAGETAQRMGGKIADGAARSGKYVQDKFRVARTATSGFASANPLVVAMVTLAAGVGIGMLLPSTERENKLRAPSRAKFSHLLGDARTAATDVAQVAKDTANDSLQAMT